MDRLIATIELIVAFFIGLVAIDILVTGDPGATFFATPIRDSDAIGQLLLGILIFGALLRQRSRHRHHRRRCSGRCLAPRPAWIDVFVMLVPAVRRGGGDRFRWSTRWRHLHANLRLSSSLTGRSSRSPGSATPLRWCRSPSVPTDWFSNPRPWRAPARHQAGGVKRHGTDVVGHFGFVALFG